MHNKGFDVFTLGKWARCRWIAALHACTRPGLMGVYVSDTIPWPMHVACVSVTEWVLPCHVHSFHACLHVTYVQSSARTRVNPLPRKEQTTPRLAYMAPQDTPWWTCLQIDCTCVRRCTVLGQASSPTSSVAGVLKLLSMRAPNRLHHELTIFSNT
jgi:hypothetical protein